MGLSVLLQNLKYHARLPSFGGSTKQSRYFLTRWTTACLTCVDVTHDDTREEVDN